MPIGPDEDQIIGGWVMINGGMVDNDTSRRITSLVQTELQHIATSPNGWERLYLDPHDGRFWELTYPRSEMQGSGPRALLLVQPQKAHEKYSVPMNP
jgi:immunity protein 27 of polymorphic toxin system